LPVNADGVTVDDIDLTRSERFRNFGTHYHGDTSRSVDLTYLIDLIDLSAIEAKPCQGDEGDSGSGGHKQQQKPLAGKAWPPKRYDRSHRGIIHLMVRLLPNAVLV